MVLPAMWTPDQGQNSMPLTTVPQISNPHAIQQIFVERLFGQFTYRLGASDHSDHLSNLMILYGDNGSGKTTILQLITHLLSHEPGKGHKSFIAKVPFEKFAVVFADGTCVEAKREPGRLHGSYTAVISRDQEVQQIAEFRTGGNLELLVDPNEAESNRIADFLTGLRTLRVSLHYLSDDRKLHEEVIGKGRRRRMQPKMVRDADQASELKYFVGHATSHAPREPEVPPLELAMDRALQWIWDRAYRGIGVGERDTNNIYTQVIKVIAESQESSDEGGTGQLHQLKQDLQRLAQRSREYSKYGLMSSLQLDEVLKIMTRIEGVDLNKGKIIYNILKPYAEGFEARLRALSEIYSTLEEFVGTLNEFLNNKEISFNMRKGFQISAKNGVGIMPAWLSSGERQILLLFCNTLASKDQAAIFIIDEPELSLNIKWQRLLVQSLLKCIKGSLVQFIFATHSIELLAQHRRSVTVLKNLEE
jgi:energy-coupling factor transporter ATP-binding protein EcfA2